MLACSRSRMWILASAGALAAGLVWIAGSAPPAGSVVAGAPAMPTQERAAASLLEGFSTTSPDSREIAAADPDSELEQATWIEGRVILPQGTPVDEHVEVIANGARFERRPLHRSPIAEDGTFRVAFARSTGMGTLELAARYLYLETARTVWLSDASRRVTLQPTLGGCVRGRLLLPPTGLPLRDALVGSRVKAICPSNAAFRTAPVDADLGFELSGVPPGADCTIHLDVAGVLDPNAVLVGVEAGAVLTVDVELKPGSSASGIVVDPQGRPVHHATVRAHRIDRALEEHDAAVRAPNDVNTLTDMDGSFDFTGLDPGSWMIDAIGQGNADALGERIELHAGQAIQGLSLALRRSGTISGRVVRSDGKPAVRVTVQIEDVSHPASHDTLPLDTAKWTQTDTFGAFAFAELCPGDFRLHAHSESPGAANGTTSLEAIALPEGGVVDDVVLRLESYARIEGRVLGPDGEPADRVQILRTHGQDPALETTDLTDSSGRFTLKYVPAGEGTLRAEKGSPSLRAVSFPYSVRPGETLRLEITLEARADLRVDVTGGGK